MKMTNLNLKEMSLNELEALRKAISEEIASRQKTELVLYTHGCQKSASYHLRKYKHWAKLVTGVDTSKTNGYAFQGDFLKVEAEHKLPVGSIVVEVCDADIFAYRLTPNGKEEIARAKTKSMSALIEKVAKVASLL
jgi:hypothetical protein